MNIQSLLNPLTPSSNPSMSTDPPTLLSSPPTLHPATWIHLLSTLYHHPAGYVVEYPATSYSRDETGSIGHLFELSPQHWYNPAHDFAYSLGEPKGSHKEIYTDILKNSTGESVPCVRLTRTCQGCKVCPFTMNNIKNSHHISVSSQDMQNQCETIQALRHSTPLRHIAEATLGLYASFRDHGCYGPLSQPTQRSASELKEQDKILRTPTKAKRGATSKQTCQGRLVLHSIEENLIIQQKDHALTSVYENAMLQLGYGPLAPCTTIKNCSTQKVNCAGQHRQADGALLMTELSHLPCDSYFQIYQPWEAACSECPRILVVCLGHHKHPIPIPDTTPEQIQRNLMSFLQNMDDLPNMTARRLIHHPAAQVWLRQHLPHIPHPVFVQIHPSLGNMDHLHNIVKTAKKAIYPHGTDWAGLVHRYKQQDSSRPYICYVFEGELNNDEPDFSYGSPPFRLAVCMTPRKSHLLLAASHLQSDIAFKRAFGWKEFELVEYDRVNHKTVVLCRAYLNRQTAVAHQHLFNAIDRIVFEDTGFHLQFRHLHAQDPNELTGILSWTVDQHRGQAKGLGLFLQDISPDDKGDLHEPLRQLKDLSPYDHLARLLRLCIVHYYRNIDETANITEQVKSSMKSLACIRHSNWQETVDFICANGGQNFWHDKEDSKFAIAALCWEFSHMPLSVWRAADHTTNVSESSHQDALRDGKHLSLLGALISGEHYDYDKDEIHQVQVTTGIALRYHSEDITSRVQHSIYCQTNAHRKGLESADKKITAQNQKLEKAQMALNKAWQTYLCLQQQPSVMATQLEKAKMAYTKAQVKLDKVCEQSSHMQSVEGSGAVHINL
ncbi:hypothetical protein C8J56DRAFT_1049975 [Mycena floridula]|nr:hypothetical protein C8J56DRAFT_1049975 [Mycena floridula]